MTSSGKPPPPERSLVALWHLLSHSERQQLKAIGGLPRDWRPDLREPPTTQQQLEGIEELERLARMRPGLIGTWPERLIDRVKRQEGE